MKILSIVVLCLVLFGFTIKTHAEFKPTNLVVVVSYPAGSSTDAALAPIYKAIEKRGIKVLRDYRPGGSGVVGINYFNRQPKDGSYFAFSGIGSHFVYNDIFYKGVQEYTAADFEYITIASKIYFAVVGVGTLPNFISNLNKVETTIGVSSKGQIARANDLLKVVKGTATLVPYKSSGQIIPDIQGGHINYAILPVGSVAEIYRDGKVGIAAVTSENRLPDLPNVAALSEVLPGFAFSGGYGIILPKGVSKQVINFYSALMMDVLQDKDVVEYYKNNNLYWSPSIFGSKKFTDYIAKSRKDAGVTQ